MTRLLQYSVYIMANRHESGAAMAMHELPFLPLQLYGKKSKGFEKNQFFVKLLNNDHRPSQFT